MPTGIYTRTEKHKESLKKAQINRFKDPIKKENHKIAMNRPEVKRKIKVNVSLAMKNYYKKPGVLEKHRKIHKIINNKPEVKEKNRQSLLKHWKDPTKRKKHIKSIRISNKRQEVIEKRAITIAKRIKDGSIKNYFYDTIPELKVFNEYIKIGYICDKTIIKQYYIKNVGKVDFYLPKENTLIFVDGDYWHCNPKYYKKSFYHSKRKMIAKKIWEYDKNITKKCKMLGYNVIRIWQDEVDNYIKSKLNKVRINK